MVGVSGGEVSRGRRTTSTGARCGSCPRRGRRQSGASPILHPRHAHVQPRPCVSCCVRVCRVSSGAGRVPRKRTASPTERERVISSTPGSRLPSAPRRRLMNVTGRGCVPPKSPPPIRMRCDLTRIASSSLSLRQERLAYLGADVVEHEVEREVERRHRIPMQRESMHWCVCVCVCVCGEWCVSWWVV